MSKYLNKKCDYDGLKFDSLKERNRYIELKALQQTGSISHLKCQPVFKYLSDDKKKVLFKYIADFDYCTDDGSYTVEDVKSPMTAKLPVFRLKKKLIEDRFKIEIHLV